MTASAALATFAPRAEAASGLHRFSVCSFAAPVLRACSSAHRIPEQRDIDGCRRSSRSPTTSSAWGRIGLPGILRPSRDGCALRFPSCNKNESFSYVDLETSAQALRVPNLNIQASDFTRPDIAIFYCTPRARFGKTPRRARRINNPEYRPNTASQLPAQCRRSPREKKHRDDTHPGPSPVQPVQAAGKT